MDRDRAVMDFVRRRLMQSACLQAVSLRRRRVIVSQWDVGARNCRLWIWIPGDGALLSCRHETWYPMDVGCTSLWTVVFDYVSMVRKVVVVQVVSHRRGRRVSVIR